MGDSTIRGAAQAAAQVIGQQAQAVSPKRVAEAVQAAHAEAAKAAAAGAQPIIDSAKAMPKQAKAIAKICIDNPALAPIVAPAAPFLLATQGVVAIHKSQMAIAKQVIDSGREIAHASHTLSPKQAFKIATNPAYMFLPPGLREAAIAGEIKRQAQEAAHVGRAASSGVLKGAHAAAAARKVPNND